MRLLRSLFGLIIAAAALAVFVDSHPAAVAPQGSVAGRAASQIARAAAPITWDFETGNLSGWIPTGTAFRSQPTFDDNTVYRNSGPANIQGHYWIGTFEAFRGPNFGKPGAVQGDGPTGTLTSASFALPPSLTFRIGGGGSRSTRVDLLIPDPDGARTVATASGKDSESMQDVTWDLQKYSGAQGFIRIFDEATGAWGHINVDDFRFGKPLRGIDAVARGLAGRLGIGQTSGRGGGTSDGPTVKPAEPAVPPTVSVPNLYGLTPNQADAALESARLKRGQPTTVQTKDPPGKVFRQTHQPDTFVPVGTEVSYFIATPIMVPVPKLAGLSRSEAAKTLADKQLKLGDVSTKETRDPRGSVVSQFPTEGSSVEIFSSINVVLATPVTVDVPQLVGKSDTDAYNALKKAELVAGAVTSEESRSKLGSVIRQLPPAGRRVDIGTSVSFVTAKTVTVSVPDIVSMQTPAARQALQTAELVVGDITAQESRQPLGSVLSQDPPAGRRVDIGTAVTFVTAKPVTVLVPSLVSLQETDARAAIQTAELVLGNLTKEESRAALNSVLKQSIPAGERVNIGTWDPLESTCRHASLSIL